MNGNQYNRKLKEHLRQNHTALQLAQAGYEPWQLRTGEVSKFSKKKSKKISKRDAKALTKWLKSQKWLQKAPKRPAEQDAHLEESPDSLTPAEQDAHLEESPDSLTPAEQDETRDSLS